MLFCLQLSFTSDSFTWTTEELINYILEKVFEPLALKVFVSFFLYNSAAKNGPNYVGLDDTVVLLDQIII